MRQLRWISAVMGLTLVLSATRAGAVTEAELVKASRKQPVLNINTNALNYGPILIEAFSKRYPFVKVVHTVAPPVGWDAKSHFAGPDAEQRLDVQLRCQEPNLLKWVDLGWLARFDDLPNWKGATHHLENDPRWNYLVGAPAVLVYDSSRIPDAEAPRTYEELAGPKWKGKVAFRNPKMGNSGAFLVEFMHATRGGLDWYERLGRNKARMVDTGGEVLGLVAREGMIGISRDVEFLSSKLSAADNKGRFKMIIVAGETPYQYQLGLINAQAPHPATARLFMNWAISTEARDALEAHGYSAGKRQREHLKRGKVWQMDNRALRPTHAAHLDEAVSLFNAGAGATATR